MSALSRLAQLLRENEQGRGKKRAMRNAGNEEGGASCGSALLPDSGRATKLISTLRIRHVKQSINDLFIEHYLDLDR